MPELPEVETVRIGLSQFLPGRKIAAVWHDWPKSFPNAAPDVQQFLLEAKVVGVKRRAKVLLVELSSGYMRQQFETVTAQVKELNAVAQKAGTETFEPIKEGFNSAVKKAA